MAIKFVINDSKTGKSYQVENKKLESDIIEMNIADSVDGDEYGAEGYVFKITSGQDRAGRPLYPGIDSNKGILIRTKAESKVFAFKPRQKGVRKKKYFLDHHLSDNLSQICMKIITYGKKSPESIWATKPEKEKS